MVVDVLSNARKVEQNINARSLEDIGRPDTTELEYMRAANRTTSKNHLLVDLNSGPGGCRRCGILHACCREVVGVGRVKHNARNRCVREDREV